MRIIKEEKVDPFIKILQKRASVSVKEDDIQKSVRRIILDVQKKGDRAVRNYTEKFDGLKLNKIAVNKKEVESSAAKADKKFLSALKVSAKRIRKFHERQKEQSWYFFEKGIKLGQIIKPLQRVGVYVPGGKAAYPSTVLMNVIPAQVAGVGEIALC
ncbi:MAG: histidinol dehydrogenase, partial [Planctomycetota bacterium]